MYEHIALVSNGADTGSVSNKLTMNVASFPFIDCTFDTTWSVAPKFSSHSVPNKLSSLSESESELRSVHRMSHYHFLIR